eukprot:scaffold312178_cov35-Tisochrysis_lutea.AAC.1
MDVPTDKLQALDACLHQRLDPTFTCSFGNTIAHMELVRRSSLSTLGDLRSFARFLHCRRALGVLLMWKEVERYQSLEDGRSGAACRIFSMFCVEGSQWQLHFSSPEIVRRIQSSLPIDAADLSEPSVRLFDEAQTEVYSRMAREFFPTYMKEVEASLRRPPSRPDPQTLSISEILSGSNAPACVSFNEFVRENYCEEMLLFWLESLSYSLLVNPGERRARANFIYESFVREGSCYEINLPMTKRNSIGQIIANGIPDNDIFLGPLQDIERELKQDLFPRYLIWLEKQRMPTVPNDTPRESGLPSAAQRRAAEELCSSDRALALNAVRLLLQVPGERTRLRTIATEMVSPARTFLHFHDEVQAFKLLFAPRDRAPVARELWMRYVDTEALSRLPFRPELTRELEALLRSNDEVPADVFDKMEAEAVELIADAVYEEYETRAIQAVCAAKAEGGSVRGLIIGEEAADRRAARQQDACIGCVGM